VIKTFKEADTERLFNNERVKQYESVENVARRRLNSLNAAHVLGDLQRFQLEKLEGDRKGQRSIRINDQYRICFLWSDDNAFDVEITKHYR